MEEERDIPDAKISPDQQKVVNQFLLQSVVDSKYDRINLTLQKGANIDAQNDNGYTPLMQAVVQGSAYMVKFLLTKDPDLFKRDRWNRTAFDLLANVSKTSERDEMTDALLGALPDHIRTAAATNEQAISMAEAESKLKQPADIVAPQLASFRKKTPKGFNP